MARSRRLQDFVHPKTNAAFWEEKINANRERDKASTAELQSAGWNVITIWERELSKKNLEETLDALAAKITNPSEK